MVTVWNPMTMERNQKSFLTLVMNGAISSFCHENGEWCAYGPDSISQVVPAEVDGSGAVLGGLIEGQRTGASQVDTGVLCVAVKHWTQEGRGGVKLGHASVYVWKFTLFSQPCRSSWCTLRSCRPVQAANSLSVPSRLAPTAWLISSAERGRSAPNNASNTPSSQEEKTTWITNRKERAVRQTQQSRISF